MSKEEFQGTQRQVSCWVFESKEERDLADALAAISPGLSHNDLMSIFPLVLRMLKFKSKWSE